MELFQVKKAGVSLSIQDQGRTGYRNLGFPVSGALDPLAAKFANHLAGNQPSDAVLEVTMGNVTLDVLETAEIAITGADLDCRINGKKTEIWQTLLVREGDELLFKGPVTGMRVYIAVSGGFEGERILGSRSVCETAGIGCRFTKGDRIATCYPLKDVKKHSRRIISPRQRPVYDRTISLDVHPGRHDARFTREALRLFQSGVFRLSAGDRMGAVLKGEEPLTHQSGADILSEAVMPGTIQVAQDGQPMILLMDAQTTGGYTSIGTVKEDELWKVAQLQPGGAVQFQFVRGG
ncbi:5-oxoprolinase subunit C family protein [Salisediminibacterium selenitireducens]|uniref:Allophanate hydrolase subunit 2 n=1 Tax=Bacillus selenitireducens (strain ATCC 700615 / DSM 15326 / MLS10) TaxID=439292 RepID=D6Y0B5_BACIE|nr:biotin-dependent carboxyltransferase family protein [Salisediminibacterium selenitireducens]ADH98506.1 Allophanate hydrolase subunit 2 [[Bacillus] selenitireducens MLS10]